MEICLNVYDVTNTNNDNTNAAIVKLNNITRSVGVGGVFHGAVEMEGSGGRVEWSFGYCENGSGVYCCQARSNSMYTYRETIYLGVCPKTRQEIKDILTNLKRAWPGLSYDLLTRNCCHFCQELCAQLEVPPPPAWLNRFAAGADATVKFSNDATALAKRVGANLSVTAAQSATWLRDVSQRVVASMNAAAPGGVQPSAASDTGPSPAAGSWAPGRAAATVSYSAATAPPAVRGAGGEAHYPGRLRAFGANNVNPNAGQDDSALDPSRASAASLASASTSSLSALSPSDARSESAPTRAAARPGGSMSLPPALAALPSTIKQKLATAGDGKQFLFGLIKTRESQLEELEEQLTAGDAGAARRCSSEVPGTAAAPSVMRFTDNPLRERELAGGDSGYG